MGSAELRHVRSSGEHGLPTFATADRMGNFGLLAAGVAEELDRPLGAALLALDELRARAPEHEPERAAMIANLRDGILRIRDLTRGLRALTSRDDADER